VDGTIRLCQDLVVDPEDVVLLAVAFELKSPRVGEWNKAGWVEGWKNIGCVCPSPFIFASSRRSSLSPSISASCVALPYPLCYEPPLIAPIDRLACPQKTIVVDTADTSCDSLAAMTTALPRLRTKLGQDPAYFQKVYNHTFDFAKSEGQRSIGAFLYLFFFHVSLSLRIFFFVSSFLWAKGGSLVGRDHRFIRGPSSSHSASLYSAHIPFLLIYA
jgi:DCN1-like protein 1/2